MNAIRRHGALWLLAFAAAMTPRPAHAAERASTPAARVAEPAASGGGRKPAGKLAPRRIEPERWDGLDLRRLDRLERERAERSLGRPVSLPETERAVE